MLTAGKVVVALAKRATGFRRKTVKPMTISIGGGMSQIVDHPVVEYFPPDVTACLAYLKRHAPDIWGDAGRGTRAPEKVPEGEVAVPAAVLRMLADAVQRKSATA